jgi:hypothetical protein
VYLVGFGSDFCRLYRSYAGNEGGEFNMKLGLYVIGVLVALIGVVWFFQGIGVIQGSFMSNTTQWTVIGLICVVLGGGLLVYNYRRTVKR